MVVSDEVLSHALEVLNRLLVRDPDAITALFSIHVPCNEALAFPFGSPADLANGFHYFGMMGVLGAIFGDEGGPRIRYVPDSEGDLVRFEAVPRPVRGVVTTADLPKPPRRG